MPETTFLDQVNQPVEQPTSDERTFAILSHVLCLAFSLIAPLVIYLLKKDESSYIAKHAKEALNFQITLLLISLILILTVIGILFLWVVGIYATVLIIVATVKASENKVYRYPFTWRLIK